MAVESVKYRADNPDLFLDLFEYSSKSLEYIDKYALGVVKPHVLGLENGSKSALS